MLLRGHAIFVCCISLTAASHGAKRSVRYCPKKCVGSEGGLTRFACWAGEGINGFFFKGFNCTDPGDQGVREMVEAQKSNLERYTVRTKDGYHLTLHRLICPKLCRESAKRQPVLLAHGLLGSTMDWVWNAADQSLGYILCASCFDVWIMNARGSVHSLNHDSLKCNETKYWKFSFHEIGLFDLPVIIDFILGKTGEKSLSVVGHSMAGSSIAVLLSLKPEYNSKVSIAVLLSPAIVMTNSELLLVSLGKSFLGLLQCVVGAAQSSSSPLGDGGQSCPDFFKPLCRGFHDLMYGEDCRYYNQSRSIVSRAQITQSGSIQTVAHLVQLSQYCKFQRFYDPNKDLKIGILSSLHECPAEYPLKNYRVPTLLISAEKDKFVNAKDVASLRGVLPVRGYRSLAQASHYTWLHTTNATDAGLHFVACVLRNARDGVGAGKDSWGCAFRQDRIKGCR